VSAATGPELKEAGMRRALWAASLAVLVAGAWGCGDAVDRVVANDAQRVALWDRVLARPELTDEVIDRMLAADSTRARLLGRIMVHGPARQDLLTMTARDRSLLEGAIQFAVQDSSERDHLMTLFRGMEMSQPR
jgi:hypothetical protein